MNIRVKHFFQTFNVFFFIFIFFIAATPALATINIAESHIDSYESQPRQEAQHEQKIKTSDDEKSTGEQERVAPNSCFIYLMIVLVLSGSVVSMLIIRKALIESNWSLSNALSESVQLTEIGKDGKPMLGASGQPVMVTKLCPSSSRVVAFMGMIVILLMFLSFGIFSLFYFAKTSEMPESIDKVVSFLVAGLTLFAPYAVNKCSSILNGLAPKHN